MNPANIAKQVWVPILGKWVDASCKYPHLNLANNAITDISPLASGSKLVAGEIVNLEGNSLDLAPGSPVIKKIEAMEVQGIKICY